MDSVIIDQFDIAILQALDMDSRQSWVDLAEQVNLSPSAVQRRTQALRQSGVIRRFSIDIAHEALGFDVEAFVAVSIERQDMQLAEQFRTTMLSLPEIRSCFMLSGTIDFMLHIVSPDLREFGRFIQQEILSLPGVKDATSSLVLETIKRNEGIGAAE